MQRIVVIGTTGSGKTTMGNAIAQRLALPHVELDALNWGPSWTEVPRDIFRDRVAQAVSGGAWVVDGNYSKARNLVWSRATTIVWLDFSLPVILWRLLRRTIARTLTQEELWSGNRERIRTAFLSRDSLFIWALQTYRRRRRSYPILLSQPEHAHLTVVRLRSPRAAAAWLASLNPGGAVPVREPSALSQATPS